MGKRKKTGECVYCGRVGPLTGDHVPPRNLFDGLEGLIKVPACAPCNNGAKKDDEHFRQSIVLLEDVANLPEAAPVVPKVVRSLLDPMAPGLRRDFLARTTITEEQTEAGICFLRSTTAVETERIDRVAERITKGLFWGHRGHRLPGDYVVHCASREEVRNTPGERGFLMAQRAKELLREPAYGIRDGRVFLYFASFDSDDANVSDWLLWFFQRFFILTATAPRHSVEQR